MHTHIRGTARKGEILNAFSTQQEVKVGGVKGSLPWFVDHRFTRHRREFGNYVPSGFPANQDSTARPGIANSRPNSLASPAYVYGKIAQVGSMPFTRVKYVKSARPGSGQHPLD